MTNTQNAFHFPDGTINQDVDSSYCDAQFNIGEKIIIEGEREVFVVVDIQNQFRRVEQSVKMMVRNVILERVEDVKSEAITMDEWLASDLYKRTLTRLDGV